MVAESFCEGDVALNLLYRGIRRIQLGRRSQWISVASAGRLAANIYGTEVILQAIASLVAASLLHDAAKRPIKRKPPSKP
jgi:hypothetical protein